MMTPKRRAGSVALAALLCASAPAAAQDRTAPASLLRAGVAAPDHVSYVAQIENVRFGPEHSRVVIVRVEHLAPNLTRRVYLAPDRLFGNSIVIRGSKLFEFDTRGRREIITSHAGKPDIDDDSDFALLMKNYRVVSGPREIIAGAPSQSLSLLNRYSGEKAMTLYLDAKTNLILEKEAYRPSGAIAFQMRFDTLRYTTAIPSAVFSTSTPPGYRLVNAGASGIPVAVNTTAALRSASFSAIEPRYLPEGFVLTGVSHTPVGGNDSIHLLYSDGLRSVSLFENPGNTAADFSGLRAEHVQIGDHEAQFASDGPNVVLGWHARDLSLTLVGDLTQTEMTKIAQSLF